MLRHYTEDAIDSLDATLFSGDEFYNPEAIAKFRKILKRWEKQLKSCETVNSTLNEMTYSDLVRKATEAANKAGQEWLAKAEARGAAWAVKQNGQTVGTLFDVCGNAHVRFSDKRSKQYKEFVSLSLVRATGNGVVEINHNYKPRQEYGLATACAEAAKKVLEEGGIEGLRIWEYID